MKIKLEVVEMLKSEFFEEIQKPDAPDLAEIFDEVTASILLSHAEIEQGFKTNNIGPDGRINDEQF